MSPNSNGIPARNGVERVRHELLTALHFGKLGPGDRVPSVRRLADVTGMNRKTVHRAYRRLAEEGLLDLRPGSGTFIADRIGGGGGPASIADLLLAVNRSRAAAESLGLTPEVFGAFLEIQFATGYRDVPVTVVECNHEQLGFIERELRSRMGVDVQTCLLSELELLPAATLSKSQAVITTDCHAAEVAKAVAHLGLPVFRLALDPGFPQRIVERARRGAVLMVVRDRGFAPVFHRLLEQMSVPAELIRRIDILETREARARLWGLDADSTLFVSPLVENAWRSQQSGRFHRLTCGWHIEATSLDRLRAGLALRLAQQRRAQPGIQRAPEREVQVHPS